MNIWAHRGLSYRYPENTIPAFCHALDYEIAGIELDIQMTSDGQIVVIHDETVDRTTNGHGYVKDMTLEQIKALDITYHDETLKIPTIKEVLEAIGEDLIGYDVLLNIELKNSEVPYPGMEEKIRMMVKDYGLQDRVVFSSFCFHSLRHLRKLDENCHVAVLGTDVRDCLDKAKQLSIKEIHPYIGSMKNADPTGYIVRAWNSGKEESLYPDQKNHRIYSVQELKELGVDDLITNLADLYCEKRYKDDEALTDPIKENKGIDPQKGMLIDHKGHSTSFEPLKVHAGETIRMKKEIAYRLFYYEDRIADELIYQYVYEAEANDALYVGCSEWKTGETLITKEMYLRIEFAASTGMKLEDLISISNRNSKAPYRKRCFVEEDERLLKRLEQYRDGEEPLFLLAADSHYAYASKADQSMDNLSHITAKAYPDALIHLGDLSDGLLPQTESERIIERVRRRLDSLHLPVYLCIGNHDFNAFKGNPDRFDRKKCEELYLDGKRESRYVDFQDLRLIFLPSYDWKYKNPYGYPFLSLIWLAVVLLFSSKKRVILFSHVPPLPAIHYWSDRIRNGRLLVRIVHLFQKTGGKILAHFHGHNHADQTYLGAGYPIVGIGAMKMEDFKDRKPTGAVTYDRIRDTATEDLFDLLLVKKDRLILLRYGAGKDRIL